MTAQPAQGVASGRLSSLQLALLSNRFEGVVRAMRNTLLRSSRNLTLSVGRDFSCIIVTAQDEILACAESLPIHVFSGPDIQARIMKDFTDRLRLGDAFVNNSPYHGGAHAADWSILVPVLDGEGTHRYTVVAKAHLADCGNSAPTSVFAGARDVYEEGALIFPSVLIQRDYADVADVIRMCRMRIRQPDVWYGDYLAMLGAARIGERRVLELIDEFGADVLSQFATEWFDYSEQRMVAAIENLPEGEVTVTNHHDPFELAPEGIPVQVKLSVQPREGRVAVDLRNNLDCQPFGMNLTESTARAAAMVGVASGLGVEVPLNDGSMRRIDVLLRENCVVGIPRHPASCSTATTHLAEHVAKGVTLALASLGDGFGQAEVGKAMPPATSAISGTDPRRDHEPFATFLLLVITNGAGTGHADGWLTLMTLGVAGMHAHDSVELDELRYPLVVSEQRIVPDSEGAGRYCGAPSAYVEYGPRGTTLDIYYTSDGTHYAPRGVRGGLDGQPAQQFRRAVDGELSELPGHAHVRLGDGETIISICTSGGGYGPPSERAVAAVCRDVSDGWVSRERAQLIYKVVIREDGSCDEEATAELRQNGSPGQ